MDNLFEKASRLKLRFKTSRGVVMVEDLWNFTLQDLDVLARELNRAIQDTEVSFIKTAKSGDSMAKTSFEIVKHIIGVKLEEAEARKIAAEKAARRKAILEALADRDDAELKSKSKEDLLKELEALGA